MMNTFYCLNQYLYNHFESSVLIVTNCSDYLNIELFIALSCTLHCLLLRTRCFCHIILMCTRFHLSLRAHFYCFVLSNLIVYATLQFLCALNIQMRTQNFYINVNSDRFSESVFEFVLITVLSLHFYIIVHIVDS